MAIDNTPPRLKLIVTITIITVITLVSLDFVFKSYFAYTLDDAQRGKIAKAQGLEDQHKAEDQAMKNAAMPLDQAMTQMKSGTRAAIIAPKQSDDLAPLSGWSKLPKGPPAVPAPPHGTGGDHNVLPFGDAGAPVASDGGATTTATDGGAPVAPLQKDGGAPTKKPPIHPGPPPGPAPAPMNAPAPPPGH